MLRPFLLFKHLTKCSKIAIMRNTKKHSIDMARDHEGEYKEKYHG